MSKLSPTWQDLPAFFKRDVAGYLDLKSRFHLSLASKWHLDLVNSCSHCIYSIFINLPFEEPGVLTYDICLKDTIDATRTLSKNFYSTKDAVESFLNLLEHPKSKFQKFEINYCPGSDEHCLETWTDFEKILSEEIKRRRNGNIKVQKLTFMCSLRCAGDKIDEVRKCFEVQPVVYREF